MGARVRLATGRGPVGTGAFLLGRRRLGSEEWEARTWLCLLFLPVVPLRRARFHGAFEAEAGAAWPAEREILEGAGVGDLATTLAWALVGLTLCGGSAFYAWTQVHKTGLLEALPIVVGAAVPVLVAMWLDLRVPRVS